MNVMGLKNRDHFRVKYLKPAIEKGFIEMTNPEQAKNRNQKYRLTEKGKSFKKAYNSQ